MSDWIKEEWELVQEALASKWTFLLFAAFTVIAAASGHVNTALILLAFTFAILSVIDMKHFILPDILTIPGTLVGLIISPWLLEVTWESSMLGALVGAGAFSLLAAVFYVIRKKHGMGFGDIKLLALIGAWAGVGSLLPTLLIASFSALLFLPCRRLLQGKKMHQPIPFGPFLILGGWASLLYGNIFWLLLIEGL
ncbi:MAG: A24 family peptidase [Alphaproteobacteria bacterium]|nr:A24 family peptidase [Alphaproteobacteria bacterium]MDD9919925.1 A24 family peptidase [Alphaproteobacteria bacterium]